MKNLGSHMIALITGGALGYGLVLSGMTSPDKVRGFLDIFGDFDPSLGLVMGSALLVSAIGFYLVRYTQKPLFSSSYDLPNTQAPLDQRLIIGSILFGLGWGISGLCPAPAIGSLITLDLRVILFVISLIGSMLLTHYLSSRLGPASH